MLGFECVTCGLSLSSKCKKTELIIAIINKYSSLYNYDTHGIRKTEMDIYTKEYAKYFVYKTLHRTQK